MKIEEKKKKKQQQRNQKPWKKNRLTVLQS